MFNFKNKKLTKNNVFYKIKINFYNKKIKNKILFSCMKN